MPLFYVLIMRSHLVTVGVLFRRIMLVDLWLWPIPFPSTRSSTPTRTSLTTAATGVVLLRIVTFFSLFRRSTPCALTNGWGRWAWVLEVGRRIRALILRVLAFGVTFSTAVGGAASVKTVLLGVDWC